jgi:hypothetical protein
MLRRHQPVIWSSGGVGCGQVVAYKKKQRTVSKERAVGEGIFSLYSKFFVLLTEAS